MEFQDKSLRCVDCGSEFIWTAGEQLFFADKQFKNEPKRCKACKAKRANRAQRGSAPMQGPGRNTDHLLGVRQGHHGALPSDAGPSGVLQGVLPAAEVCRRRRRLSGRSSELHGRCRQQISARARRRVWPSFVCARIPAFTGLSSFEDA